MKPKVYLETSVISYLTGRFSRDRITAANQLQTRAWWEKSRSKFDLYISQPVLLEVGAGDLTVARSRLALIEQVPRLDLTRDSLLLADEIVRAIGLPKKARLDALHIAIAAVNEMDFLLTWNCSHIANAVLIPRVSAIVVSRGFRSPFICTPPQLLDGD